MPGTASTATTRTASAWRHPAIVSLFIALALSTPGCGDSASVSPRPLGVVDSSVNANDDVKVLGDATPGDAVAGDVVAGDAATGGSAPGDAASVDAPALDTAAGDAGQGSDSAESLDSGRGTSGLWLLSVDNSSGSGGIKPGVPVPTNFGKALQKVSVATGKGTVLCKLKTNDGYPSLTFGRDGTLYASNNTKDRLDVIDPCSCKIKVIGDFKFAFLPGITSDHGSGLFGIENTIDILVKISTTSGNATKIGSFGYNFGTGGTTWSDALNGLYAIDGTSDTLYTLDPKTGAATKVVKLDKDFGSVGMELHPANNVIYACTTDAILYWVDPKTGKVTPIGPIGQKNSCTNLAAPWGIVKCVDG